MIDDEGRQRIESAIAAAEVASRAELVAVIARRAGEYRATGLAFSTAAAFFAGVMAWLLMPWSSTTEILLSEFIVFLIVLALLEMTPLGDRLTPRHLKAVAARRLAKASFLELGLAATPERNAVLFFVSLAEHHVEIIADGEIHQRVGAAAWQRVVDEFTGEIGRGKLESGFTSAIATLGALLAQHYPSTGARPNALANRLIVLP